MSNLKRKPIVEPENEDDYAYKLMKAKEYAEAHHQPNYTQIVQDVNFALCRLNLENDIKDIIGEIKKK